MNNNKTVVYGDTRLEVPANTSIEELKVAMAENFPELRNADVHEVDGQIIFAPKAGTKGADNMFVVYGDTRLEVPGNTNLDELKVAMAENFPELRNADVHQVGNEVVFAPKAGTKGAHDDLTVIYGDTRIQVPANTSVEELKLAMAENFPELRNADVHQGEGTIIFSPKAGTKGI